jgi:putative salt-induced outer membrane protein YdiY
MKYHNFFTSQRSFLMTSAVIAGFGFTDSWNAAFAQTTNTVPQWDVSVALGLTATKGNSDTVQVSLTGRADKKWDNNELHLGIDGTYGEQNDVKNNESIGAFAQLNHLLTERWYVYGRVEALHDAIADIEYRVALSPGIGYYIIKDAQTSLSVEAGPGVIFEKQGPDDHQYFTARIAEKFEHKFNDRVRIWESVEFLPQVDHVENYIINAEAGIESALSKAWALRLVLLDTYDHEPAPGRTENDFKVIAAVAWKLLH